MSRINNILTWTCLCPRGFSIVALMISGIFCIILIINAYCTYNLKHKLETYINFIDAFSYDIEKSIIAMNSIEEFAIANNISQEKHINLNVWFDIIKDYTFQFIPHDVSGNKSRNYTLYFESFDSLALERTIHNGVLGSVKFSVNTNNIKHEIAKYAQHIPVILQLENKGLVEKLIYTAASEQLSEIYISRLLPDNLGILKLGFTREFVISYVGVVVTYFFLAIFVLMLASLLTYIMYRKKILRIIEQKYRDNIIELNCNVYDLRKGNTNVLEDFEAFKISTEARSKYFELVLKCTCGNAFTYHMTMLSRATSTSLIELITKKSFILQKDKLHTVNIKKIIENSISYHIWDARRRNIKITNECCFESVQLKVSEVTIYMLIVSILYHMIAMLPNNKSIDICAQEHRGMLRMMIIDNGFGVSVDKRGIFPHSVEDGLSLFLLTWQEVVDLAKICKINCSLSSERYHGNKLTLIFDSPFGGTNLHLPDGEALAWHVRHDALAS